MAINFPHNPNVNDVHTEASLGRSWKWDGTTWLIYSSSTTGIAFGDLSVSQQAASGTGSLSYNNAGVFTYTPPAGGGGGSSAFTGLNDTPGSLTAGKWLKVNTGGTALEWTDAPAGNDTNDYLNTASLSGNTLILTRTGTQALLDVTVDLSSLNPVPTNITVADESTDTECYPLFSKDATGNIEPKTGSNIKFNSASGQLEAGSFKKTGGTSSEFLKADGSIDSSAYSTTGHTHSYALNDLTDVDAVTGAANGKILKYNGTSWEIADDSTGGGGSGNFTGLSDTPNSLTAGKWLKVNAGATALEYTDAPSATETDTLATVTARGATTTTVLELSGGSGGTALHLKDGGDLRLWNAANTGNVELYCDTDNLLKINGGIEHLPGGLITSGLIKGGTTATGVIFSVGDSGTSGDKLIQIKRASTTTDCNIQAVIAGTGAGTLKLNDDGGTVTTGGSLQPSGGIMDKDGQLGTSGQVLSSTGSQLDWIDAPSGGGGATINNNGDNRIITGSATTGELNAESDLTYDGTKLNFSNDRKITFGNNLRMEIYTDGSINYIKTPTDGGGAFPLSIYSGSDEVIKIDDGHTQILTGIKDKDGDLGSSGQVLSSTGTQVNWIDTFSGSYNDLTNKPTIPAAQIQSDWNQNNSAVVDFIKNKPTLPAAQIQSDWNQTNSAVVDFIKNKPTLFSGSYNDLTDKPTILTAESDTLSSVTGRGSTTSTACEFGQLDATGIVTAAFLNVKDPKIILNSDFSGSGPTEDAFVRVERGNSSDVDIKWNESSDKWQATNDGSNYFDIGSGDVPSGSVMLFYQTSAPTGWTKSTSHNNKALRVVSGNGGGSGGSVGFTSAFANHTVSISGSDTVSISDSDSVSISGNCGGSQSIYWNTTQAFLTVDQMPSHQHDYDVPRGTTGNSYGFQDTATGTSSGLQKVAAEGGSNYHTHAIIMQYVTGSNFSFSGSDTVNISGSDTVNISGSDNVNAAVQYLDVIICSKN